MTVFTLFNIWGNLTVGTSHYKVASERLPDEFSGYKIAQISDLHNAEFGRGNSRLISILKKEKPDIIVITGDLIDSGNTNTDVAVNFVGQAAELAPCCFVTGNHEAWIGGLYDELEEKLLALNVKILHGEAVELSRGGETVQLIGIDDFSFANRINSFKMLDEIKPKDGFRILLSHRPEVFDEYVEKDIDLVLSGHAHGGQFGIPFVGGVVAPNQGFFPKYDAGKYHEGNTTMIVSRGVGNSIIPVRINNRPEVVIVELDSSGDS